MDSRSIRHSLFLVLSTLMAVFPAAAGAQVSNPGKPGGSVPNRLLVRFAPTVSDAEGQQRLNQVGARPLGKLGRLGIHLAVLPPGVDSRTTARGLARQAGVLFAEADILMKPSAIPNDPQYGSQWHLPKISGPSAWDQTTGSSSVVVAILDSGCDPTHPDLSAKYVPGWNFFDGNNNTADVQGHGTAVAGTAASAANNGNGVASPAWNCKIMPLRISDTTGYAYWSTVATALEWAANNGARVANVSYNCSTSATVQSAAQYFQSKGGVVCISAGNDSATVADPDNPYVLTVSATNESDSPTSWTNRGNNVDVAAPGINILTTSRGGGYGYWWGTSFSAPTAAGVAALVISANPNLSGAQAMQVVKDSADDLGTAGWDQTYGAGRVNASRAVSLAKSTTGTGAGDATAPQVTLTAPTAGSTVSGTITMSANASDNVGVTRVEFWVDGTLVSTDTTAAYSASFATTSVANGAHTFKAVAFDAAGNSSSSSVQATVSNTADTQAPTVTITSPANGATVTGNTSVTVDARDNVGVSRVELYVNGVYHTQSTLAPFTTTWNTRNFAAATYTLQVRAYDAAGNSSLSQPISVTLSGSRKRR